MSDVLRALFFTAAVVCFVVHVFFRYGRNRDEFWLVSLGLAFFVAVFAFDAWSAVE